MSPSKSYKEFDVKSLKGITQDSRQVHNGFLFGAFPGTKMDGRDYIKDAISNGASAILAPIGTVLPDLISAQNVTLITDKNPRLAFAKMAAEFYGLQPECTVAVTGTNGKTSVAHFVKQLWKSQDLKAVSIGTLGVRGLGDSDDSVRSSSMTTPDPVALHARLADMAAVGVTHLAMEASSHGLDQYRLDGVKVHAAGFTNLTHDHLDYHTDMEEYFAAKARLFSEILSDDGVAVLNADVPEYEALAGIAKGRGIKVLSYGEKGEDLKLLGTKTNPHGQVMKAVILGEDVELHLSLVGGFQAMNALCALGLVLAQEISPSRHPDECQDLRDQGTKIPASAGMTIKSYITALEKLQGAPGRLQPVPGHPKNAAIYIDYAHTPDALETVLKALRPHTDGRLVCVFGCGGSRDRSKRRVMGKIAAELADHVIVTDDNPRSEDPAAIREEVLQGAQGAVEIGGRAKAIQAAVQELQDGDVLLIAGKGHEHGQIFADHTEPFDDFEEAKKAIGEL